MSKKSFLDSIEVKTPCLQSWDEMRGSDQIRFCDHCAKDVHNLSRMTRKQAKKIVARSNGEICVRYVRRPDGRIETIKNAFHQITRQTGIAAGILGASLSLSTLAFAQSETDSIRDSAEKVERVEVAKEKTAENKEPKTAAVSGTITDQMGAVIPNATVILLNEKTDERRTTATNDEGTYYFKDVAAETYNLKVEAASFKSFILSNLTVADAAEIKQDVSLEINGGVETVGASVMVEYEHALFTAVSDGDLEAVKLLIAKGENVNAKDKNYNGITALFVAVEHGNSEIVKALLNAGAKVNARDNEKRTPLMMLDEDATAEFVNLLLRQGAKPRAVDKEGNTVLHGVAAYGNAEVVRILIDAGADIDAQNEEGATALMSAAEAGNLEAVKTLLEAGADANLKNKEGESALDSTSESEIKDFLIAYGANR